MHLIGRLMRTYLPLIKNRKVNDAGVDALRKTLEHLENTCNYMPNSNMMRGLVRAEMEKTKWFLQLLLCDKKELLFKLKQNEHECRYDEFIGILKLKTTRRDEFTDLEKNTLKKMLAN